MPYLLIIYLLSFLFWAKRGSPVKNQDSAQDTERRVSPERVIAELRTPVAISVHARTHQQRDKWEKLKTGFELFGVVLVLFYVIFTYCIMKSTSDALKHSDAHFLIDERPWVGITSPIHIHGLGTSGEATYTYTMANSGKTPATGMFYSATITGNDKTDIKSEQTAQCNTPNIYRTDKTGEWGDTIFPNQPWTIPPGKFPNDPRYSHLYFVGCISYNDIFGKCHHTHFCFETRDMNIPDQDLKVCAQYNDVEDCK